MSSNWGNIKYEDCNYSQDLLISTGPGLYRTNINKYENQLGTNPKNLTCVKIENDKPCNLCNMNINATINNDFEALSSKLITIDSNLRLQDIILSKCDKNKYHPVQDNKQFIVVNPLLCDRSIVPTNMKMPMNSGLENINI